MNKEKKLLTTQQAASLLGMNESMLKRLVQKDEIQAIAKKSESDWQFDKENLKDFVERANTKDGEGGVFSIMRKFLITHADEIQKLATRHHKEFLGGRNFRTEHIEKYQENHIKIVEEFANNLRFKDVKHGNGVFKKLGTKLAHDSVKDKLTIEEAVDGIIFMKQAVWQLMEKHEILDILNTKAFYEVSHAIGTYCDVITSQIVFSYHNNYVDDLKEEKEKVEKAVKIRDNFISAASHELKTPITSLKVYLQGLKKRIIKEPKNNLGEYLEKIEGQVSKLTTLIEDLLNITKLQHGKLEFTMREFNINDLVREASEAIQSMSNQHEIIVVGKAKRNVVADRNRIHQVITNLLTNAIKYSPQADRVTIRVATRKDSAVVSVQDLGIGISPDQQKKIFQQFYRVTDAEGKTFPGMGMGLFIANEIIKRHGSQIAVTSHKNKGSTFSFTLPYVSS
jgi:signal transduction histidine kinase